MDLFSMDDMSFIYIASDACVNGHVDDLDKYIKQFKPTIFLKKGNEFITPLCLVVEFMRNIHDQFKLNDCCTKEFALLPNANDIIFLKLRKLKKIHYSVPSELEGNEEIISDLCRHIGSLVRTCLRGSFIKKMKRLGWCIQEWPSKNEYNIWLDKRITPKEWGLRPPQL